MLLDPRPDERAFSATQTEQLVAALTAAVIEIERKTICCVNGLRVDLYGRASWTTGGKEWLSADSRANAADQIR